MAKRSGLGQQFWICQIGSGPAYQVAGDIGAIDTAQSMVGLLDDTGIDKSAMERLAGLGDGNLAWTAFWNNAAGGHHAVVSLLNGLAVRGFWAGSATEGDGLAFACSGILDDYHPTRAATGALTAKPKISSYTGDFPDWGVLAARATDASGTVNHVGVDMGFYGLAQTITNISQANPAVVTVTAHGYVNGDSVNITGSNSGVSIDGDWVVSNVTANTFTVPVNQSGAVGNAGTVTKTSTRLGGVVTALLTSISSGTNYTLQVQSSADNGVADGWANVAGLVTTSLTAAAAESRVRVTGVLIKRWIRLVGAGTYSNANIVGIVKRVQGVE